MKLTVKDVLETIGFLISIGVMGMVLHAISYLV